VSDAPSDDTATEDEPAPPEPEVLHGVPVGWSLGQQELFVPRDELIRVVKALHEDGYLMCVDLCAVDYLTYGVLRLTLRAEGYDWRFVPVAGSTYSDSGSSPCR